MFPGKIEGYVAREAPVIVLTLRKPRWMYQLIKWNTSDDTFQMGQWFAGTFFSLDLSPNGELMAYRAGKKNRSWTVISKPPYFTALALWWHVSPGWIRPHFFRSNESLVLESGLHIGAPDLGTCPLELLRWDRSNPDPSYYSNLSLWEGDSGWRSIQNVKYEVVWLPLPIAPDDAVKAMNDGDHTLINLWRKKVRNEKVSKIVLHHPGIVEKTVGEKVLQDVTVVNEQSRHLSRKILAPDRFLTEEWADFDQAGRIVFARKGKIYVVDGDDERMLVDLSSNQFEPVQAPDWAKEW